METKQTISNETQVLRHCVRELAALTALSAVWSRSPARQVAEQLGVVLSRSLSCSFVYVRLNGPVPLETICTPQGILQDNRTKEVCKILEPLFKGTGDSIPAIKNPFGIEQLRVAINRLGVEGECGVLIVGSTKSEFTEADRLLLNVAANQAAIVLQQKLSQEELRRREHELADFFDNATVGLHWVGPDGTILRANRAELALLGYSAEEYIGHNIAAFHADENVICDILRRLQKGEELRDYEAQLRCRDGSIKHVLINSNVLWEDDKFIHTRCITRDITYLKQAERDRALLAAIVECSHDAIYSVALDGTIRSWNSAAEQIFEYSAKEAVGKNISIIVPQDRIAEESEIFKRLKCGERIEHYETVRIAKSGKHIDVSLSVSPLRDTAGKLIGASKASRNITERKKIEARLHQSQEELQNLLRLLPVGVYTCEAPSGKITYWNDHAVKLWGRQPNTGENPDRYCGSHRLYSLSDGSFLRREQCPMVTALQEGRAFRNVEVEVERPDGSRWIALVSIDPIRNDAGQVIGAINVFQDMSALKQAELKLKEADRRKDEFLATLAHELRNPLAPIRNSLHVLRMAGQNPAAAARVQQMMERQVSHLVRLVDDLLEISRISRGKIALKKERLSISTVVQHALETSKPFVESGNHSLNVSLPDTPTFLDGDAVRLSQVISNLLNNAAKYMETGGNIALSVHVENETVAISVRDNGIGIPREMLSRVFEMFVQVEHPLRRAQDGLGIGLSLVQTLVSMHGGQVEAKSDGIGCGSEFIVRLPLASKQESKDSQESAVQSKVNPVVCRILVVDDNKDSAESLGMMLNFLGADVRTVYNGKSALESINVFRPTVIFMDLGMPELDGCEVARLIRQRPENKEIRLIALTGWGQEEDRRRSREAGFDQHLVKPIEFEALQAILSFYPNGNK